MAESMWLRAATAHWQRGKPLALRNISKDVIHRLGSVPDENNTGGRQHVGGTATGSIEWPFPRQAPICNVPAFSSSCCLFSSGRSDVAERVLGITCQQQDSKYGTENKQEGNKETNDGSDNQVTQR
ncbi:hypothetical protein T09_14818 [Trichinella sp. T9]|uniref:Uncharacterized protein n=1 Tax=Trichinella murrelli TaxID=144512 RepID=A0A0V0TAW3_9BILA|nr:hypothetical protein T05_7128 [Trichinella murrelli]KRX59689.1 hypothetical protein T09_14818 [Trichinella sp. T9]